MTQNGTSGGERILVVDDEPDIVALVVYHLAKAGFKISTASNGADALRLAQQDRPALVVLDLMLPGMSGLEVLDQLRADESGQDIAVLLLTARLAQSALRIIAQRSPIMIDPAIEDMARRARRMLSDALDAFVRADGILGREVCQRDDQVDALHDSLFRILLTHMMADPKLITPSLELLLVSRNLERVADLATNIAEDAVFLAEGKQIKHRSELKS
jgi:CheY-like chemotaxis protein